METERRKPHHPWIARWGHLVNHAIHLAGFAALTMAVTAMLASATSLTDRQDSLTVHTVGALSSHSVQFSLSGANTWVAGESIAIDFHEDDDRFSVDGASIVAADLSVDDGTERTIFSVTVGSPSCVGSAGADDVAVGIDDAAGVITFLACPSFSASAAAASLTISIGAAAGGTNRITNPAAAGSYPIDFSSAAGDCEAASDICAIAVVIVDGTAVAVTATVNLGGGNSGGSQPTGDTTAPVISAVSVTSITKNSATVTWTTNEGANSAVNFGTSTAYTGAASNGAFTTSHSVPLSGLSEGTVYHFQVCSIDGASNATCASDATFTTLDETPPVISSVSVTVLGENSARFTWTTGEASSTIVDYDLAAGPSYASSSSDSSAVTSHDLTVTGLTAGTTYHFRVRSADASGNEAFTADATFVTPDSTAPVISGAQAINITTASADIVWTTSEDADSRVEYGATASYGSASSDGAFSTAHSLSLVGLSPATTYHFRVISKDPSGNEVVSSDATFVTLTPAAPVISGITVTGITQTAATVQFATDVTAASAVEYGLTTAYGGSASGPAGTSHSFGLVGLSAGTTYHFRVRATDSFNQTSTSADQSFVTASDVTPPGPVTNFAAQAGDGQVLLTWTNPSNADRAGTRVLRKTGSFSASPSDGTIVYEANSAEKIDSGLANGTEYFYTAYAFDGALNFSSPAFVRVTPSGAPLPLPQGMCSDSDGGSDYDTLGSVTTHNGEFPDRCIDASVLEEQSCVGTNRHVESHDCGSGFACDAGRCVAAGLAPTPSMCGNGVCEADETATSCLADCPAVPQETPVDEPADNANLFAAEDLQFFVGDRQHELRLTLEAGRRLRLYPATALTVVLPDSAIHKPIRSATVNFNGSAYAMRETHSYEATISIPLALNAYPLVVVVEYEDGTGEAQAVSVSVVAKPRVVAGTSGKPPLAGAVVTLLHQNGEQWDGASYAQQNPQQTGSAGRFGFIAPEGVYRLRIEKEGYRIKETLPFTLAGNIVLGDFELILLPDNTVSGQAGFIAKVVADTATEIADNPIVEEATKNVAVPVATTVAVINVVAAGAVTATAIPYLSYLVSLLAQPLLLFSRRKRRKWGVVYNSLTKLPIDLAIIRLLDAKTGRLIRSMVTDKEGRYFFIVPPGSYRLAVVKAGFVYPSTYLAQEKEDATYADLYHGETITMEAEGTFTMNIPVDPLAAEKTPRRIVFENALRKGQKLLGVVSIVAMAIAAIITPTPLVIGLLIGNILLFFVFRRLSQGRTPKTWGVVYDSKGKPVGRAIARVFDTRFNKLLETQVTDANGRYSFLVGRNTYYVTYDKLGYEKTQYGPVDFTSPEKEGQSHTIAVDVVLKDGGAPAVKAST